MGSSNDRSAVAQCLDFNFWLVLPAFGVHPALEARPGRSSRPEILRKYDAETPRHHSRRAGTCVAMPKSDSGLINCIITEQAHTG
jgi:hypothetical protein